MENGRRFFLYILTILFVFAGAAAWWGLPREKQVFERQKNEAASLSQRYGLPLPWDEVKKIFPRYVEASLVDVDTKKRFQVVRRGGTYHADIQPVTAEDTRVLLEIYGGKWSWKRKSVVMEIGMQKIAASINGMPHGYGKIKGNDFKGHFCVHFLGSRVHTSGKVDTAHQMMVWKAAGKPEKPFLDAEPQRVIELVVIALNHQDGALASLGISSSEAGIELLLRCMMGEVPSIVLDKLISVKEEETAEYRRYQIQVSLLYPGETKKKKRTGEITVRLDNPASRWLIEGEGLKQLLFSKQDDGYPSLPAKM